MRGAPESHRLTAERMELLAGAARLSAHQAKPQMKVPFLDLKAHHAPLMEEQIEYVASFRQRECWPGSARLAKKF
jgi:hypothetical protein